MPFLFNKTKQTNKQNKTKNEKRNNLLFECPIYALLRSRHIPDSVNENDYQKYLVRVLNDESQEI